MIAHLKVFFPRLQFAQPGIDKHGLFHFSVKISAFEIPQKLTTKALRVNNKSDNHAMHARARFIGFSASVQR
ncbi:hypothetical protein [Pseudomonas sp. B22129]|uniref:hypothetical protein n=1 Tax=Pseudomonas sp. B22129 TaxID=3235111 RepID=UPI00378350F6